MAEAPFQKLWEVGEVVTAADLNSNIRDGFNYPLKDKPQARSYDTVGQSVPNVTWTNIIFQLGNEQYDSGNQTFTNHDQFDITVPGLYLVTGNVSFASNSTGGRAIRFTRNGNVLNGIAACAANNGDDTSVILTRMIYFARGDILRMQGYQDSTVSINTQISFDQMSSIQAVWLSSDTFIR